MLLDYIINNVWICVILWAVLYASDYMLTIVGARLYQQGVQKYIYFEKGYELNPYFEKDVAQLKLFSSRFVFMLLGTSASIFIARLALDIVFKSSPAMQLKMFEIVAGCFILMELAIHGRHFRNILFFKKLMRSLGIDGRIEYSRWLSHYMSSIELLWSAFFYFIIFLLTGRFFFIGGALSCLAVASKSEKIAQKK